MPDVSAAQKRLMQAAEHTPGGYDGVPQSVGKKFVDADKAAGIKHMSQLPSRVGKKKKKPSPEHEEMAHELTKRLAARDKR